MSVGPVSLWRRLVRGAVALSLALPLVFAALVLWPLPPEEDPPVRVLAPSEDGWMLALHHRPACGGAPCEGVSAHPNPVLLCHGLTNNRFAFDLGPSLAKWLAARGFDVWMVELRGHGDSVNEKEVQDFTLKDFMKEDAAAAIEAVRQRTGAEKVAWVGHSMGGMVLLGHLALLPESPIAAGVTLGSPGHMEGRSGWMKAGVSAMPIIGLLPWFPAGIFSRAASHITDAPVGADMTWQEANIEPQVRREFLARGVERLWRGEVRSFLAMMESGRMVDPDGTDLEAALAQVQTPVRFIAGSVDQVATPDAARRFYDHIGSTEKDYRVIGKESGALSEYGHGDLLLGKRAPEEVFVHVEDWLRRHAYVSAPPQELPAPAVQP